MKSIILSIALSVLSLLPGSSFSDLLLGPGDTYVYSFSMLPDVVSVSPGLPVYDDYSFTLSLSGDLYNKPPDDIRIRLYEDPADLVPVHNIFGESVPNLSVTPSNITIFQVPGTLWFDRTGRVEVEVLAGSVNVHHLYIDLGPGQISYSSYIEAVPEPGSLALTLIGAGGLFQYRRRKHGKREKGIPVLPKNGAPEINDVF